MVHKVLFWSGFGVAVRLWQLGIEMRPMFQRESLWAYPMYAGVGATFGYWLKGVENRQMRILSETRDRLLEKRQRRAEREGINSGTPGQKEKEGLFASPTVVERFGLGEPQQGQRVKTEVAA